MKKAVVGLFAKAVENPKTKKIATIIPLKGNIKDPKTSGWQTFVGILKNAFIHALREVSVTKLKEILPIPEAANLKRKKRYLVNVSCLVQCIY